MSAVVVRAYRLLFGMLALTALVCQFVLASRSPTFIPLNFFGFFTNLSNILAVGAFLACGLSPAFARSRRADVLRGAATLYLAVTAIVFATLLSELTAELGIIEPWVNVVVHELMPAVVILDWLLNSPGARPTWRDVAWWLAFPLAYLGYSEVRGAITGWYPYPFLDPAQVGSARGVAAYVVAILLGFVMVAALVRWTGQRRRRPSVHP